MSTLTQQWEERYWGGKPEAERLLFERLAQDVVGLQLKTKRRESAAAIVRAAYPEQYLGVTNARLQFVDLPEDLRTGYAQPGKTYGTAVRFSGGGTAHGVDSSNLCGVALRVTVTDGESHDLLFANSPCSHARDARQFVGFARARLGNRLERMLGLGRLISTFGPFETIRLLRKAGAMRRRRVLSLDLETYWSASAIRWGDRLAVRYLLRPPRASAAGTHPPPPRADQRREYLANRLRGGDIAFEVCVQRYLNEVKTPIEDASVEWRERVSAAVTIATLTIPRQDVDTPDARAMEQHVSELAFNPWHTTDSFRPLGNLNRARKAIYAAGSAHRLSYKFLTPTPLRNRIFGALADAGFRVLNRYVPWHRLPRPLSLLNVAAIRHTLRQCNLIDTGPREAPPAPTPVPSPIPQELRSARSDDGSFNDLADRRMGSVGAPFGRNMKHVYRPDLFDTPDPVRISDDLLGRTTFVPASWLNVLSAAWIQFQVHDWVHHARYPLGERDVTVKLPKGRMWRNHMNGDEENVMRFGDNIEADPGVVAKDWPPILFANQATHWWDASEVYGSGQRAKLLREGARLRLTPEGYLPEDVDGMQLTGFNESWWLGLSAMHTLFAREHNVICDALRSEYPHLSDERIYQTARLVVSALIAKIHTVEWTPAILATKVTELGLKTSWYGATDMFTRLGLWLLDANAVDGIPKTKPDHHTAPYALTEEFATVYRMHQLIPDDYQLFHHADGRLLKSAGFREIQGKLADGVLRRTKLENVLYSFGIAHPGAVALHNFPNALRTFERENGERVDLAVVDIVRERRRGIPRYNDFRQGLHKPRVRRWEDLTSNPESIRRLKDIYKEIDLVDTVVGLVAETPPKGFGFSDTAFRIFILMAARRLQSDRFLTVDFRPEIYTPLGMDWVARNGMTSVILRHCPGLHRVIPRAGRAFAPWPTVAS